MPTDYGLDLYNDVLALTKDEESPFYFQEFVLDGKVYRIFNYRLASYTDFLKPSGLEVRGHMFEVDKDGKFIRLAALPPAKFFNNKENPFVMDVDFSKTTLVLDKMDGSIMTTFEHDGRLMLKSKGSLESDQGRAANEFLQTKAPFGLVNFLNYCMHANISVTLEWTAPQHRIVLPYQESNLTVLLARSMDNGQHVSRDILVKDMEEFGCIDSLVKDYYDSICDGTSIQEFIESIPAQTGREGYVIYADGILTKHKTDWYCALHHTKDSVGSDKRLFECVVNEAHDDLRGMFPDDAYLMGRIDHMEALVKGIYHTIRTNVEEFYTNNRELDRKSYAIKGTAELEKMYFALAMNLYLGKENDYKAWMLKHYKDFGIGDEVLTEAE